ncbi:amidohydrolase [Pontibacter sp. CAU 1760]
MMHHTPLTDLPQLIQLRHKLHQHPELSGMEQETGATIQAFLATYTPDATLTALGGTGIAAIFEGTNPDGPVVLFRAELDGLPIPETGKTSYTSLVPGRGHLCGHDGHMTVLTALASMLYRQKPETGKVILLFQPAEENGAGAWAVLQDKRFQALQPDYVFALHNLPGLPLHQVVVREEVFAAASTGMVVALTGSPSHAAEPENGLNPGLAMAEIIQAFNGIVAAKEQFEDLTLLTVIHARLGEMAFGTNPGFATVMATLRSFQPSDFEKLKHLTQHAAHSIAGKHGLGCKIHFVEEFPATVNHPEAVQLVRAAAETLQLNVAEAPRPFRWSEDFGHFTGRYKGALFGLGAGVSQPPLHDSTYDFPDELIPTGARLFYRIATAILNP